MGTNLERQRCSHFGACRLPGNRPAPGRDSNLSLPPPPATPTLIPAAMPPPLDRAEARPELDLPAASDSGVPLGVQELGQFFYDCMRGLQSSKALGSTKFGTSNLGPLFDADVMADYQRLMETHMPTTMAAAMARRILREYTSRGLRIPVAGMMLLPDLAAEVVRLHWQDQAIPSALNNAGNLFTSVFHREAHQPVLITKVFFLGMLDEIMEAKKGEYMANPAVFAVVEMLRVDRQLALTPDGLKDHLRVFDEHGMSDADNSEGDFVAAAQAIDGGSASGIGDDDTNSAGAAPIHPAERTPRQHQPTYSDPFSSMELDDNVD